MKQANRSTSHKETQDTVSCLHNSKFSQVQISTPSLQITNSLPTFLYTCFLIHTKKLFPIFSQTQCNFSSNTIPLSHKHTKAFPLSHKQTKTISTFAQIDKNNFHIQTNTQTQLHFRLNISTFTKTHRVRPHIHANIIPRSLELKHLRT